MKCIEPGCSLPRMKVDGRKRRLRCEKHHVDDVVYSGPQLSAFVFPWEEGCKFVVNGDIYDPSASSTHHGRHTLGLASWPTYDHETARRLGAGVALALERAVPHVLAPKKGPLRERAPVQDVPAPGWERSERSAGCPRWIKQIGPVRACIGATAGDGMMAFWFCYTQRGQRSECTGSGEAFTLGNACLAAEAVADVVIDVLGDRLKPVDSG